MATHQSLGSKVLLRIIRQHCYPSIAPTTEGNIYIIVHRIQLSLVIWYFCNCCRDSISNEDSRDYDAESSITSPDDLDTSSSSNSSDSKSKRRKRGLRRYEQKDSDGNWVIPHIPLPRIPKQDIRRNYGQMFANVFNSGSRAMMGNFLHQMMNEHGRYTLHSCGKLSSLMHISAH